MQPKIPASRSPPHDPNGFLFFCFCFFYISGKEKSRAATVLRDTGIITSKMYDKRSRAAVSNASVDPDPRNISRRLREFWLDQCQFHRPRTVGGTFTSMTLNDPFYSPCRVRTIRSLVYKTILRIIPITLLRVP